jgi:hypothetical protein
MKKKKDMINHIPIKQVWLKENIILIKDVQIWMDKKMLKNPIKKRFSIKGPKFKNWIVQKMKRLKKPS